MSAPTTLPNPLNNIRRGELKRLFLHRGISKIEVHNQVEDILAERKRWTARALGERVDLNFNEKIRLGIRTVRCADRSEKMMKLYFREQKRERDRMRWHRMKQSLACGLSPAAKKLADRLFAHKWMSVADIVEHLGNRRRRKREAARSAVRRALNELIAADVIDVRTEARRTGGFERLVRLKKQENTALLDSSVRKKAVDVKFLGEANVFRPPVKRPLVKYSPPRRQGSMDAGTSDAERGAKEATRPIDFLLCREHCESRIGAKGWPSGSALESRRLGGRPSEQAGMKREGLPPVGGQSLGASDANGEHSARIPIDEPDAQSARPAVKQIAPLHVNRRPWPGIEDDGALTSLPDQRDRQEPTGTFDGPITAPSRCARQQTLATRCRFTLGPLRIRFHLKHRCDSSFGWNDSY